jgi:hypothetical protein
MKDNFPLLETLDRLFDGDRKTALTLSEFLEGLQGRSYAFAILALDLPNCVPTGIPWVSTITGIPMLFLLVQYFAGHRSPALPQLVGRRGIERGKLHDLLDRIRPQIRWLEAHVHVRLEWWVTGLPRRALLLTWALVILLLALPIPFDNFIPAWTIFFFCFALLEDDGLMAIVGWVLTVATVCWTIFLVLMGHAAIMAAFSYASDWLF